MTTHRDLATSSVAPSATLFSKSASAIVAFICLLFSQKKTREANLTGLLTLFDLY